MTAERDPAKLPHAANGIELALECTGFFTDRAGGEAHIEAGAKRVLISAPAKGVDLTVVYGVNDDKLTAEHKIVSNASCTTNCLAPVAKVLNDALGIERGLMTTVHAYTNDQKILDQIHPDLRRARAAAMSMIPTTTGAARAVGEVLPELKGKLDGSAIRVPVPDVSLVDLTFTPKRDTTRDEVNQILKAASETERLKGILDYTDEPLVSIDLQHTARARPSTASRRRCSRASWCASSAGTTMNGASRTAWSTPRQRWGSSAEVSGRFKTLDDLPEDLTGKKVLVRVDLNVPMDGAKVTDDTRLRAMLPTVLELSDRGAIVLLLSHFGRPKGESRPDMSTAQLVLPIHRLAGRSVRFIEDCQGPEAERAIATMLPGNIGVLENTRFHAGEEKNDPELAKAMAALGDYYVDDAFSTAHRAHASTEGITHYLPSFAGRAMEAELNALERALGDPERPVAAVVGGAKVSTKLAVLGHLVGKVDHLIIGGGMANTFLAARGVNVGKSLCEHELTGEANAHFRRARKRRAARSTCPTTSSSRRSSRPIRRACAPATSTRSQPDEMILDIGPAAVEALADVLKTCRTLVWNGPLGAFETPPFDEATVALAKTAAALTKEGSLVSVAGGGDTVAALNHAGVAEDFTFVSTAGGAFLEWMEGRTLPGVAALEPR